MLLLLELVDQLVSEIMVFRDEKLLLKIKLFIGKQKQARRA